MQTSKIWFPSHVPAPDSHLGRLTEQLPGSYPYYKLPFQITPGVQLGTFGAIPVVEIFQQYFKLCPPDFRLGRGSNPVVFLGISVCLIRLE